MLHRLAHGVEVSVCNHSRKAPPMSSRWSPKWTFENGIRETIAWYRENEAWWRGVLGRAEPVSSS